MATATLSRGEARRLALAAQAFARPRPTGKIDRHHLRKVLDQVGYVQIDAVNVLVRAQYMPFFSRLGAYDVSLLDEMAERHGELTEYWGHAACLMPADRWASFAWRMRSPTRHKKARSLIEASADKIDELRRLIAAEGPLAARDLETRDRPKEPWWDWTTTKLLLEDLFQIGELVVVRRSNFEREYGTAGDLLPEAVVARRDSISDDEARTECLMTAARALGVATAEDLGGYVGMRMPETRPLLDRLVADGRLDRVEIEGWDEAFLYPDARTPRRIDAQAFVSPFDPVAWDRDRLRRLFGFDYKIEIYVPETTRVWGYYVLPFLLDDQFVGRADLKAERARGRLLVRSAFVEAGQDSDRVSAAMARELSLMAGWLGLDDIDVDDRGDLASALKAQLT